jgi:hypothetical protein
MEPEGSLSCSQGPAESINTVLKRNEYNKHWFTKIVKYILAQKLVN